MPETIRILIADDHPIFRHGLRMLLEAEHGLVVVGEAEDGDDAVRLASSLRPDVLLLDLAMPRRAGLSALEVISERHPEIRTIILTARIEKPDVLEALRMGARGVVLKEAATELLLKSIGSVVAGQYWIGRDSVSDLVDALKSGRPPAGPEVPGPQYGLTPRELEVVAAVVTGLTNKEIAQKLEISQETVKHHLGSIFDKTGASNRVELALLALERRLVDR